MQLDCPRHLDEVVGLEVLLGKAREVDPKMLMQDIHELGRNLGQVRLLLRTMDPGLATQPGQHAGGPPASPDTVTAAEAAAATGSAAAAAAAGGATAATTAATGGAAAATEAAVACGGAPAPLSAAADRSVCKAQHDFHASWSSAYARWEASFEHLKEGAEAAALSVRNVAALHCEAVMASSWDPRLFVENLWKFVGDVKNSQRRVRQV